MKNGARYAVKTHWGTFSLDEGAYQDYLAGKLWITWKPGTAEASFTPVDQAPLHVSRKALALRDQADRDGVLPVLQELGVQGTHIPYSPRLSDVSIEELNLSVRAGNGLKRVNVWTFGQLMELIHSENGIMAVRNLGQKSAKEIRELFAGGCYLRMFPYERAQFWQEVFDATNPL